MKPGDHRGLGLVLDRPSGLPLELAADFCILDRNPDTLVEDYRMEMWGLSGKLFF